MVSTRRQREIISHRNRFIHKMKNGIYDPMTFYHVLDALLDLLPDQFFRTADLIEYLNASRPQIVWDSTTVGRVVTDMAESLSEANRSKPIEWARRWNGQNYQVSSRPEDRKAMENLLDDLAILCEAEVEGEQGGAFVKRVQTPMSACPSVVLV